MIHEDGFANLWKGLTPALILSINSGINTTIFDNLRVSLLSFTSKRAGTQIHALTTFQAFMVGIASKSVAALVCYPITRIKVMTIAQTKNSVEGSAEVATGSKTSDDMKVTGVKSFTDIIADVYRNDGIWGFYIGLEGQVFNAALKFGLNMMIKERIQHLLWLLFFGKKKAIK